MDSTAVSKVIAWASAGEVPARKRSRIGGIIRVISGPWTAGRGTNQGRAVRTGPDTSYRETPDFLTRPAARFQQSLPDPDHVFLLGPAGVREFQPGAAGRNTLEDHALGIGRIETGLGDPGLVTVNSVDFLPASHLEPDRLADAKRDRDLAFRHRTGRSRAGAALVAPARRPHRAPGLWSRSCTRRACTLRSAERAHAAEPAGPQRSESAHPGHAHAAAETAPSSPPRHAHAAHRHDAAGGAKPLKDQLAIPGNLADVLPAVRAVLSEQFLEGVRPPRLGDELVFDAWCASGCGSAGHRSGAASAWCKAAWTTKSASCR